MSTAALPEFGRLANGFPTANWNDDADDRWLVAVFLRSDIGASFDIADEIIAGLQAASRGIRSVWNWTGNSFRLEARGEMCILELCDVEALHHRPAVMASTVLKEIVTKWMQHVSSSMK